jgi:hypothetical protein
VARWIAFADVRLGLDDDPGHAAAARFVDEDFADEITRDIERRAVIEITREATAHGWRRRRVC